jgi:hypothetical protein
VAKAKKRGGANRATTDDYDRRVTVWSRQLLVLVAIFGIIRQMWLTPRPCTYESKVFFIYILGTGDILCCCTCMSMPKRRVVSYQNAEDTSYV